MPRSRIVHARLRVLGHRRRTLRREGDGSRYPTLTIAPLANTVNATFNEADNVVPLNRGD